MLAKLGHLPPKGFLTSRDTRLSPPPPQGRPVSFFNGNTFADIGRRTCDTIFSELPTLRRRELVSVVAHSMAGVLDRDSMISAIDDLWQYSSLVIGDRVPTLRGSASGVLTRLLEDGRVAWRPDSATRELLALPESLRKIS